MGVPGFYSWLTKRYPLIKHMVGKHELPKIDYLYLDMNGIIYKCVKDNTLMFKDQLKPRQLEKIWIQIFNYINMIVNVLKPNKMIMMGLDGVAPRSKLNNQRARRFRSAKDYAIQMEKFRGFSGDEESQENFKNNSISPGTKFMAELNNKLHFFIKKKIQQDDYWKTLNVVFTGSDVPGEGEHKIMEFIRANVHKFDPEDSHCLYGADADLIMLSMALPIKNLCIIREQFIPTTDHVKITATKKEKSVNFQLIFVTLLKEYFQIEYKQLQPEMHLQFNLQNILNDFVFLFFFIGNDFLPRCMAYNIRQNSIQKLIIAFKQFLLNTKNYIVGKQELNLQSMAILLGFIAQFQSQFINERAKDAEKYLKAKKDFENQVNQRFKEKMKYQENYLLQIKTFYQNQDGTVRKLYYQSKFSINPTDHPQEFYNILIYYLYGLQFVYEYYFINLPSWQWYYPYYYAPLLGDFSMYIQHLVSSNFKLSRIDPGTPFQPFKQLMCVLPKQSAELLPQSFRHFLTDQQSMLRTPIDFYPTDFDEDLYGSTRSYESICLIPFLDLNKITEAYQKGLEHVSEEELVRNQFVSSVLYKYDEKAKNIIIQSPISSISKVKAPIRIQNINLRQKANWLMNAKLQKSIFFKMPTLKIKHFLSSSTENKKTHRKTYVLSIIPQSQPEEKVKLGEEVFYGFPLEHSGLIEGQISADRFISLNSFNGLKYMLDEFGRDYGLKEVIQLKHRQLFGELCKKMNYEEKWEIDFTKTKKIYFIQDTMSFIRCQDGNFKRSYIGTKNPTFTRVPAQLISKKKLYENTRDEIKFPRIEQEFYMQQDVIVFPKEGEKNVYKGKVIGYQDDKVKIRSISLKRLPSESLTKIVTTKQIYFTLKFCAFIVRIKPDILLTILDSIPILLQQADLPPSIDIGLNFISRSEQKLVTNIVRINYDKMRPNDNIQKDFMRIQVSMRGFQLIIKYREKFPQIIKFIQKRHQKLIQKAEGGRIDWREPIKLSEIYEQQREKATKSLMNVYFWLVKKEQTDMPLSSIFSKQVSISRIKKLQEMFRQFNQTKEKYIEPKQLLVDPNYVFSRRLADLGYFGLARKPKYHQIRDQVICLKPQLFGEYGIIIGIDDDRYEVLFQRPSFGKSDLNGLSNDLLGGKFFQRELFNLHEWPKSMQGRNQKQKLMDVENIGWDGEQDPFLPRYKENPLNEYAEVQLLNSKKNLIDEDLWKYIQRIKAEEHVQKIDEDYQVVDTRNKKYEHKYDRGKVYIEKEFVEKIQKQKKYIEKPVVVQEIKVDDFKEEVIQNKVQEPKKNEQENEEEQDGEDIFNS